jgi:hypothetical protein
MTRGDVHLVRLGPTLGSEIQKTRPCVIVSPDETQRAPPHGYRCADDDRRSWYVLLAGSR